jgi:hypothetical protein
MVSSAANPARVLIRSIGNQVFELVFAFYDLGWLVNDWHASSFESQVD